MSVFSGEQGKKQAFLVVLPGKLDLENSPLMLGFCFFFPSVGGFHITAGKFDSISKSCVQVSWLTGGRGLDGRGVGSRAEAWAQLRGRGDRFRVCRGIQVEQERAEPPDEEWGGGQSGSWCRNLLERGGMQRWGRHRRQLPFRCLRVPCMCIAEASIPTE